MLTLVPPNFVTPSEIADFRAEFAQKKEKIHGSEGLYKQDAKQWLKTRPWLKYPGNFVFFSYDTMEDLVVGIIRCTTTMSACYVLNGAYNIGYSIRPSMRGQGFGKAQLELGLEFLMSFGDEESALISARIDNIASKKIILSCGGEELRHEGDSLIYKFTFDRD